MSTSLQAQQASLSRRILGWLVQATQEVPIPAHLPYARNAQAWEVALMKQYNELGDEPEWLKGCDLETHLMYWEQMGELAKTQTRLEVDLAIWSHGSFYVYPTRAGVATTEGGQVEVTFLVKFPDTLDPSQAITPA